MSNSKSDPLREGDGKQDSQSGAKRAVNWRRRYFLLMTLWTASVLALSHPEVRGWASAPLLVHDETASGEVAYVMADGHATWERLRVASDLYHNRQVERILLLDESHSAGFNYVRNQMDTRVEKGIDYLGLYGVPSEAVLRVPINQTTFMGSLAEARGVAEHFPDIESIVVVTSAPHTRRSLLCFRRTMPDQVKVSIYAASGTANSAETHSPIWLEYAKLCLYFFVA